MAEKRTVKRVARTKPRRQTRSRYHHIGRLKQHPRRWRWKEALKALLSYRKRYGDCRVPFRWPQNRWLGQWVARMRTAKKKGRLTKDEIRDLDRIGFTWSIVRRSSKVHLTWEQLFKKLEAFKKTHWHCNVPRNYSLDRQLAYWVDGLRSRKKKGKLDKERIRRLNELGFSWSLLHRRFRRRDMDEFVALVAAFKKRNGHCDLVAAREGVGLDFRWWVMNVRKSKKQGRLDPRRVRQLDRLGFLWEPGRGNR